VFFLKDETEVEADIVIGADGIKSKTRELVLGFKDAPKSSGYACYSAFFPGAWLKVDPLCAHFVEKDMLNVYIGEMHMVQNTLRDGDEVFDHEIRLITVQLDYDAQGLGENWQQPGNLEDVHKLVEGWSPDVVAAVHKMKECLDWKICYRDPLPTWVSCSGKVTLIGDSAHPHLPHPPKDPKS
jgi:salicylate hydroxylase